MRIRPRGVEWRSRRSRRRRRRRLAENLLT